MCEYIQHDQIPCCVLFAVAGHLEQLSKILPNYLPYAIDPNLTDACDDEQDNVLGGKAYTW